MFSMPLFGIKIIQSNMMTVPKLVPKRVHKRARIQKKWNKRYGFKTIYVPIPEVIMFENCIIGHEKTLSKIINSIGGK